MLRAHARAREAQSRLGSDARRTCPPRAPGADSPALARTRYPPHVTTQPTPSTLLPPNQQISKVARSKHGPTCRSSYATGRKWNSQTASPLTRSVTKQTHSGIDSPVIWVRDNRIKIVFKLSSVSRRVRPSGRQEPLRDQSLLHVVNLPLRFWVDV